ncbi:TonB-dependent receptor domain-containing protein [Sphingorhabdus sp.]|uniref:TonB-dependent receptor domain-containing protein n=1 Tax=Sphingorhabdus sp. TaxID=1902408 RepID=UPI0035934B71
MKKSRLLVAGSILSAAILAAVPTYAQEVSTPDAAEKTDEIETENEPILVTGSRIRLPNLNSIEPTTTIDNRQLRERNVTNIADALNELPGIRGSVTPAGAQGFGQGVNFVNSYGLGSNRTLTLINGRRFVSSNVATLFANAGAGTQVDLNVLPSILTDRIDTVSVGGAPVYGSDAISGVVNIFLRSKFNGAELSFQTGISEEGDNTNYNVSGLFGRNFLDDRLNVTVALSYDKLEGLVSNDREFLRRRIGGATNPSLTQNGTLRFPGIDFSNDGRLNTCIGFNNSPTDGNPGTVLVRNTNIPFLTRGGLITGTNLSGAGTNPLNPAVPFGVRTANGLQFDTAGNLVPFNQGIVFPGTTGSGNDGFRFVDFSQITSDLNRFSSNAFITFDVSPDVELFFEGTYFRSRADELVQQPTFNSSLFGGLSGQLSFSVNNPFLTDQARAALVSRGVTSFNVSRASADYADLTGFNKTRLFNLVGGVKADLNVFGGVLNFETYVSHGNTKSRDFGQDLNAQNFINAVNVTRNSAGQIVCTTAPTRLIGANLTGFAAPGGTPIADPNCVPLNVFGEGRASKEARDYVVEEFVTVSEQTQSVFNANIGGGIVDLWAGPIGFNIGYEHREEKASFTPSDFQQAGRGRTIAITPLAGKYNLDELFGELRIPLVIEENNIPFIHNATLTGRTRYSHNTVNGGFFSFMLGGTISPIQDIELRGNFTRSFRSPAITELFLPVVNAFAFVPDLCQPAQRNAGAVPAIRARNCAAFIAAFPGTDFSTPDPASTASVPSQSGGNPNLENEQADSFSFGTIIRPSFIPRLFITADYIDITLNKPIANLNVAQIASACFDNENFNASDPANGNSFCSQINYGANGRVQGDPQNPAVVSGFVNGNRIKFSGVQGTLGYDFPLFGGNLTVAGDMLYVRRRLVDITGVAPSRSDGTLGDPEFSGQLRLRYVEKNFGTTLTMNYTGEQLFNRLNRAKGVPGSGPDAREIDQLRDFVTFSGGVFIDATDDFRLTMSVTNLFNRQGQKYFGELIPASFNDLIGRRFQISARATF